MKEGRREGRKEDRKGELCHKQFTRGRKWTYDRKYVKGGSMTGQPVTCEPLSNLT